MLHGLSDYLEKFVIPEYNNFDAAHGISHVRKVIKSSLEISRNYDVSLDMVFTIAAYHDIGIKYGRKFHHLSSGVILSEDENLRNWFSETEISIMKTAVEEHRASLREEPETIYGKIVSAADRELDIDTLIERAMHFGYTYMPFYDDREQFLRVKEYIYKKYSAEGQLKLWLESEETEKSFAELKDNLSDSKAFERRYKKILMSL